MTWWSNGEGLKFTIGSCCLLFSFSCCARLVATLETDCLSDCTGRVGNVSFLFSNWAISKSVFRIGSPAWRERIIVDGGTIKIVIISVAVWHKKTYIQNFGYFLLWKKCNCINILLTSGSWKITVNTTVMVHGRSDSLFLSLLSDHVLQTVGFKCASTFVSGGTSGVNCNPTVQKCRLMPIALNYS